eukprot:TRINITY_DN30974_c0_g1_i1.p1 TRINITY_DN30974_c0_g1~~TRINITY_DN30974_c0_g1_i1.p1  ORF type:complete len:628 (+),score=105.62 TRINITY_DN30974_c0_g1_i1:50-1885(+)
MSDIVVVAGPRSKSSVRRANEIKCLAGVDLLDVDAGGGDLVDPMGRRGCAQLSVSALAEEQRAPSSSQSSPAASSRKSHTQSRPSRSTEGRGSDELARSTGRLSVRQSVNQSRLIDDAGSVASSARGDTPQSGALAIRGRASATARSSSALSDLRARQAAATSRQETGIVAELRREITEKDRGAAVLRDRVAQLEAADQTSASRQRSWEGERETLVSAMQTQVREVNRLGTDLGSVRKELAAVSEARQTAEAERDRLSGEVARLTEQVRAAEAETAEVRRQLERQKRRACQLSARLRSTVAAQQRTQERADIAALTALIDEAESTSLVEQLEVELHEREERQEDERRERASQNARDMCDSRVLAELTEQLEEARAEAKSAAADREVAWAQCGRLTAEMDGMRQRLASPQSPTRRSPLESSPLQQCGSMPSGSDPGETGQRQFPRAVSAGCRESPAPTASRRSSRVTNGSESPSPDGPAVAPPRSSALQGTRTHFGFVPAAINRRHSSGEPAPGVKGLVPALSLSSPTLNTADGSGDRRPLTCRAGGEWQKADGETTARNALARRRALQEARDARKSAAVASADELRAQSAQLEDTFQRTDAMRRSTPHTPV